MIKSIDVVIPAYNAGNVICQTVEQINCQQLPDGWDMTIIVYDDCSTDKSVALLTEVQKKIPCLKVIAAGENGGRSLARNNGVASGSGSVVLLCDADCRFSRPDTIAEFIREIESGADAVIGLIELGGNSFWAKYTNGVSDTRITDGKSHGLLAYTTQNMALRRSLYGELGGYSLEYKKYGFEDRDFLLRLGRITKRVVIRPDVRASHDDDFTLEAVCRKQTESGRYSAPLFRRDFPDEYRTMPYAKCDYTMGKARKMFGPASAMIKRLTETVASAALRMPVGFRAQRFLVRIAMCTAFFHGTKQSTRRESTNAG